MPKTAVHEKQGAPLCENHVWFAWQTSMDTETKPVPMKGLAKEYLGLGIFSPDA